MEVERRESKDARPGRGEKEEREILAEDQKGAGCNQGGEGSVGISSMLGEKER